MEYILLYTWTKPGTHALGKPASSSGTCSSLNAYYCDMPADGEYALAGSHNDWSVVAFDVFTVSIVDAPVAAAVPATMGMVYMFIIMYTMRFFDCTLVPRCSYLMVLWF